MKLSIVIPTYNEEKYLGKTLDSIKGQSFKIDNEVIVSDSNSSDNTLKIAKYYGAKIVRGPKKGPSLGRNLGAKKAKNDYLLFINADIIMEPNLFSVLNKNLDKDCVAYLVRLKPDNKSLSNRLFFGIYNILNSFLVKYFKRFAIYPGEFICIKRSVFEEIGGFNTKYHLSEDRDMVLKALSYGKVKFLEETYAEVSVRRMKKWGWINFLLFHLKSHLYYTLKKKPLNDRYEEIR